MSHSLAGHFYWIYRKGLRGFAAIAVCNRCDHVDSNMSDYKAHPAVVYPVAAAPFA
jgi:hypothetical protein